MTLDSGSQVRGFLEMLFDEHRVFTDRQLLDALEAVVRCRRRGPFVAPLYRARVADPRLRFRDRPERIAADEMGAPPKAGTLDGGRINPPGIRVLYLAEDPETAITELRPTRGAVVCVAQFAVTEPLTLFDFVDPGNQSPRHEWVASMLGRMLSLPENPGDRRIHGAAQFIAGLCKACAGSDVHGIRYASAVRPQGANVALFDWPRHKGATFPVKTADADVTTYYVEEVLVRTGPVPAKLYP